MYQHMAVVLIPVVCRFLQNINLYPGRAYGLFRFAEFLRFGLRRSVCLACGFPLFCGLGGVPGACPGTSAAGKGRCADTKPCCQGCIQ